MVNDTGVFPGSHIAGLDGGGVSRINEGFHFIQLKGDTNFDPDTFLAMIDKLERLRVIRPYCPRFGSSRAASVLHTVSQQRLSSKKSGSYKVGHGDTLVVWYWEFDTEKRYFHEFQTVNYEEAMAFYRAEKFTMCNFDEEEDGG
ncbi:hypothetical protein D9756_007127 [Leucocoprinus leucothites]|uniref:Uncharacterized protein n=1 Tax=Leucocoprinus leucothites TaxID=201217 RepID=A0A8H5D5V4_9AGAR|nr:hypothetical protein D9756_007127 [Leucoagaricus leucothites]